MSRTGVSRTGVSRTWTQPRRHLLAVLAAGLCAATLALAAPLPASAAQQAALSPDDVATLGRVERYLNDIKTLQGRFVQTSSNGAYAAGAVYPHRPGQLRSDSEDRKRDGEGKG